MSAPAQPLARDLDEVLEHTRESFGALRGARIFLTGGTGFFGAWLLESLVWAIHRLQLDTRVVVLSRSAQPPAGLAHLFSDAVRLHQGDVRGFAFPEGRFDFVVHAATTAATTQNQEDPLFTWETIVDGTRRVLDFARDRGARRLLLTSSGAIYGRQPPGLSHLGEEDQGALDPSGPKAAYGEGKRAAEQLCRLYLARHGVESVIARGFAFVGPYLPLDSSFAIGNFIRDGLAGEAIRIGGDGTPLRTYLYGADLASWLWTMLVRGQPCRPYNLGSDQAVSIAGLAGHVAAAFPERALEVKVAKVPVPGAPPERYVPAIARARDELGLAVRVPLNEAIQRTVAWYRQRM